MNQLLLVLACACLALVQGAKVCNHKEPGAFEGNPTNCGEFFMCRSGRPVLFSCPANMYFDVTTGACNFHAVCAEPVVASDEDSDEDIDLLFGPEYLPIVANPSRLQSSSNVCQGALIGSIRLDTTGCSAFFHCTQAGPVRLECPAGTLFDSNRKFCEVADLTSCAFEQPSAGGPSSGTGVGNLLDVMCFGKKVGTKYGHPTNCSQYFLCNGRNAAQLFTCPRGTAYDKARKICDFAHNVSC